MSSREESKTDTDGKRSAIVAELFDGWEAAKVLYVNWKSSDHLEAGLCGQTDLDVLVDRASVDKALRIAHDAGFRMFKTAAPRAYPGVWDYVAYDPDLGHWLHLHLHAQIVCGDRWVKAYRLPFEAAVLASRRRDDGLETWVIDPAFELLVFLYRMNAKYPRSWHKKGKLLAEARYLCAKASGDPLSEELDAVLSSAARLELEALIRSGSVDPGRAQALRRAFDPRPYLRLRAADFRLRSLFRHSYRLAAEFNRRIRCRYGWGRRSLPYGGYLAAFVGIDGSGKSTNIARVLASFASQMNVKTVFFGSGKSGASLLRKAVMSVFGFKATLASHKRLRGSDQGPAEAAGRKKDRPRAPLYYLAWQYLCLRDKERALASAHRAVSNGALVLADRWPQDQLPGRLDGTRLSAWADSKGLAGRLARREAAFLSRLKLLPLNQVIVLGIDPDTSLARKPGELTREQAASLILDLDRIEWPTGAVKTVVDARRDAEAVEAEVVEAVWRGVLLNG